MRWQLPQTWSPMCCHQSQSQEGCRALQVRIKKQREGNVHGEAPSPRGSNIIPIPHYLQIPQSLNLVKTPKSTLYRKLPQRTRISLTLKLLFPARVPWHPPLATALLRPSAALCMWTLPLQAAAGRRPGTALPDLATSLSCCSSGCRSAPISSPLLTLH